MTPRLSANGKAQHDLRHAVLTCECFVGHAAGSEASDLANAVFGQLRAAVSAPTRGIVATLPLPVSHVVGVMTQKQMVRAAASRVIAFVKDLKTDRNRAVGQLPRQAMGGPDMVVAGQAPISVALVTNPFPTNTRSWVHLHSSKGSI